jgi:hypothetical protein
MPLYGLRNAKSYACNPPQFDLKKLFQKNLKKRVETGILLYTKQVVSDESSKTTTT